MHLRTWLDAEISISGDIDIYKLCVSLNESYLANRHKDLNVSLFLGILSSIVIKVEWL